MSQELAVGVVVGAAALYLLRAGWAVLRPGAGGCGSGCSKCSGKSPDPAPGQVDAPFLKRL